MNPSKQIKLVFGALLIFGFTTLGHSQKLESKLRVLELDHTISSSIMGQDYQLYISFSREYSNKDTINQRNYEEAFAAPRGAMQSG